MNPSAHLLRRFGAMLYDFLVLVALWMGVAALALWIVRGEVDPAHPGLVWRSALQAAIVAVTWAYFVFSWRRGGQTIGMRAWRIRVVSDDGAALGLGRASARWILAIVSLAALGAGFFIALVDRSRRSWHDRICATRVERIC